MKKTIFLAMAFAGWIGQVQADPPASVTLAGTMQTELGCPSDWMPSCSNTHLIQNGNTWSVTFTLPAGTWEYKIALNDAWTESYGYNMGSANAVFTLAEQTSITFNYDQDTHLVTDNAPTNNGGIPQPDSVTIAGDLQSEIGCAADWAPECVDTQLLFDADDQVWKKTFTIPAGTWNYKAALDGAWTENYGRNATAGGDNISFTTASSQAVIFYYSHQTHWVTNNVNSVIATAVGDFQTALGCPGNWQPECLLTWMQDPDGNGLYTYSTTQLPIGDYQAKVALNEAWDESYGDNGSNINFSVTAANQRVVFTYDPQSHDITIGDEVVTGDLRTAKAYWLDRDTVALNISEEDAATATVRLHYADDASLTTSVAGVAGGNSIDLVYAPDGLSDALKEKFPHLSELSAFSIKEEDADNVRAILTQQIAVSATRPNGSLLEATGVQMAGALDDLFAYDGNLGVTYSGEVPSVKLWAPTAQSVTLHVYDNPNDAATSSVVMTRDDATGVWSVTGDASWNRKYYLFEVDVFVRNTGAIEKNWVTDPYSLSTSLNSKRSQFVNLQDDDLKPEGWDGLAKPALAAPEDIIVYELHVRDFSVADTSIPEDVRGTFMAFTELESNGMKHLKGLADAGLTHIHLLPASDCATINEDKSAQLVITDDLSAYAPDSESQQDAVDAIRGSDGFNWCYDPYHYTVPEGSYSTNPSDVARIREFRSMVAALNKQGLRVIMDVVYNHTSGSLLGDTSVLDKIVPGYYHRLNSVGNIETSTCCANTASENLMMEKLMRDSIKTWAVDYKVDGFRFDIMGHHTKANIVNVQNDIHALTQEADGIDGSDVYFYGEGWNFGEVQDDARFVQARIGNMDGTGIGVFNNFIRDAVRGGGPFDAGDDHVQHQSFINGLYLAPNASNQSNADSRAELLRQSDILRVTLAGSLSNYPLINRLGNNVTGADIEGAGFAADPQETINYIEAHDNETLFDMIQYKAPLDTSMTDRVRIQNLGNSVVLFAQGIPFLHAGQEMLRSKSTDRNSYDSGDWFNAMDFTYTNNGWGKGLPLSGNNSQNWSVAQPLLANTSLKPTSDDIAFARGLTEELIKIRKSSSLFRLRTAEEINNQVTFYNTGVDQVPGIIVMAIRDSELNLDPNYSLVTVLFNANTSEQKITLDELKQTGLVLHPVQQESVDIVIQVATVDNATGEFTLPARSTLVFVAGRPVSSSSVSSELSSSAPASSVATSSVSSLSSAMPNETSSSSSSGAVSSSRSSRPKGNGSGALGGLYDFALLLMLGWGIVIGRRGFATRNQTS